MRSLSILIVACCFLITANGDGSVSALPVAESAPTKDGGYSIQTGYEGYLVPSATATKRTDETDESALPSLASLASFTSSLFNGGDPAQTIASLFGAEIVDDTERKGDAVAVPKLKLIGAHGKPVFIPIPKFLSKHSKFPSKFDKFHKLVPKKTFLAKFISKTIILLIVLVVVVLLTGGLAAAVCTLTPLCTISFAARDSARSLMDGEMLTDFTHYVLDSIEKFQEIQKQD